MWTMRPLTAARLFATGRLWPHIRTAAMSTTTRCMAVHEMTMPALSPTMERGNLGNWKVQEGDSFNAGDVLLEVVCVFLMQETDKAMMDVEANDDGVMAKIVVPSGSKDVDVNKLIAFLAEEGDDLSNLELPDVKASSESATSTKSPEASQTQTEQSRSSEVLDQPSGTKHVSFKRTPLPSVLRLAHQYGIEHPEQDIKGTGIHGLLTKGDVLAYLGKAKSPFGTSSGKHTRITDLGAPAFHDTPAKKAEMQSLTADEQRDRILAGLIRLSTPKAAPTHAGSLEELLRSYLGSYSARHTGQELRQDGTREATPSSKRMWDQTYAKLLR